MNQEEEEKEENKQFEFKKKKLILLDNHTVDLMTISEYDSIHSV